MRICILGMGQMGRAFTARALEKGHQVTVWNRTRGRAEDLVARGAPEAESARAAVAGADAVLVVLADDAAVVDVCMGPDGVLGALEPGAVLANISTVAPDTARQMADAGPDSRVLDTPVMGSPLMISRGLGQFLIGGSIDAVTAIGPVWEDLGAGYVHCGPPGSGATLKVISNLLLITGVAALAEAIATARGHGISDDLLRSLLANSFVVSPATKLRLDSVLDSQHPGWFSPALARKDVRLAIDLAEKAGIAVRVGPATEVLLTSLIDDGRNWPDFAAIIEALR
jgi:3-hydroxyisobutyrate dehydrogenase-like beta-hydroxyacid dehydrogenase